MPTKRNTKKTTEKVKKPTKSTRKSTSKRVVREEVDIPKENNRRSLTRLPANLVVDSIRLPQRVVGQIADEVVKRLKIGEGGHIATSEGIDHAVFLDTSAIIDGRIFELIELGVFTGPFVLVSGVLSELKNIADSKDPVKRERGRIAMSQLVKFKREQKK